MPASRRSHAGVPAAQHLGQVPAEYQDKEAEYPANHQIDDLEQHLASQPAPLPGRKRQRSSAHAIEYSSGTGLKGAEAILTDQQRRLRREYRRFHLTREHERLYPATPQGH
jgi:hypothetical protein